MQVQPLEPRRVRYPRGAYGWVDLKVVTSGTLRDLGSEAAFTYLFLCAVGNTLGVSFWSRWRMAQILGLPLDAVEAAVQRLVERDLIATNGKVTQVLPLPTDKPETDQPDRPTTSTSPATSATSQRPSTASEDHDAAAQLDETVIERYVPEARRRLARITPRVCTEHVRQVARALALEARRDQRG